MKFKKAVKYVYHDADWHYAKWCHAEWCHAECHSADCCGAIMALCEKDPYFPFIIKGFSLRNNRAK
jgi:hypothetical protein